MIRLMTVLLASGIVSGRQLTDFKIYALPVGQGEALVLECPSRDISIVDLGSSDSVKKGFWNTNEVNNFFNQNSIFNRIKNIVISHNDVDHYNLLPTVFASTSMLPALENIYISLTERELPSDLNKWITKMKATGHVNVQLINRGQQFCSLPQDPVIHLNLCPRDGSITSKVLFANLGTAKNTNTNSIVFRIEYNQFSVLLNGDFDDIPDSACGRTFTPADKKVQYGKMRATVYKLAHHGSTNNANNDVMLKEISPKAIFVSANPWFRGKVYSHPRCHIITYLITNISALCLPASTCSTTPFQPQSLISCCEKQGVCNAVSNKHAVYTTTPKEGTANLITLATDGFRWSFS